MKPEKVQKAKSPKVQIDVMAIAEMLRALNPKSTPRIQNPKSLLCALSVLCVSFITAPALAASGDFLLVRRSLQVQPIKLVAINEQSLVYLDDGKGWVTLPLDECIALLNPYSSAQTASRGLLTLADGQRLTGEAVATAKPQGDSLAWNHPWLGRIDVPFKQIQSVLFTPAATAPPAPGKKADVVLLANGDRQEGLVLSMGDPITLEVDRDGKKSTIDIPMNLVVAMTMLAGRQPYSGRRIWFEEGTVLDVQSISVGDDGYVRLAGSGLASGTQPTRVSLSQIAAVLLDSKAMLPLATLTPSRVEGPATRFTLPKPLVIDPAAPLGLSKIEIRGPLVVRYALPASCLRFTADVELPRGSRQWGDCELLIRMNDEEVFRRRMNAANPAASINVPVTGREMTIEITQGAYGPVQDQVILQRAMLLKKP